MSLSDVVKQLAIQLEYIPTDPSLWKLLWKSFAQIALEHVRIPLSPDQVLY